MDSTNSLDYFIEAVVSSWYFTKVNYDDIKNNIGGYKTAAPNAKLNNLRIKTQSYEYIMRLMIESGIITEEKLKEVKKKVKEYKK